MLLSCFCFYIENDDSDDDKLANELWGKIFGTSTCSELNAIGCKYRKSTLKDGTTVTAKEVCPVTCKKF